MPKIKPYTTILKQISDLEQWLKHTDKCCFWEGARADGQRYCNCSLIYLDVVNEFDLEFCHVLILQAKKVCTKCNSNQLKHKAEDGNFYHKKWDAGENAFSEYCESTILWQLVEQFAIPPVETKLLAH
jgi:hypothetical protein